MEPQVLIDLRALERFCIQNDAPKMAAIALRVRTACELALALQGVAPIAAVNPDA